MGIFKRRASQPVGDLTIYYSTPYGDTRDGRRKLFLLERDGLQYFPVFRSAESLREFYERSNRAAYMILEGDVKSVVDTMSKIDLMRDIKIVVEPLSENPEEIWPGVDI